MSAFSTPQRTLVGFAGSTVAIDYADPRAAEMVEFLIHPSLTGSRAAPQAVFQVDVADGEPPLYTITCDGAQQYQSTNPGDLAEFLQSLVCRQLAMESRDGLLFHAAALVDCGRGVLIPGGIGAGKSTLTAWLLSKGLQYLTDELVYIPWGSEMLQPYPRPLHLKRPSRAVLRPILDLEEPGGPVLSGANSDLMPAGLLNPDPAAGPVPLRLALFPFYQAGSDGSWQALSMAQTGQRLMQSLINARNLPDHGFHEAARLARLTQGYRLTYAHFDQVEQQLAGILSFRGG